MTLRSIEICAGGGGQALGLEQAGFEHVALVEYDSQACNTLRYNRPSWNVIESDVKTFSATDYHDIDLLAGGVPCPPFSVAGKQLGRDDDRDLFPEALRLVQECNPRAVLLENVKGLFAPRFKQYRDEIIFALNEQGYRCFWTLVQASDFGISQNRQRTVLVALKEQYAPYFSWAEPLPTTPKTVGELLFDKMSENGWQGVAGWAKAAHDIAPTLVGGSKKHGGPDLGPTRAKAAWKKLGVDGKGIANTAPEKGFVGNPRLTVEMAALIQGFHEDWVITGKKTPAYRQVGNAFPPPVAKALGLQIKKSLEEYEKRARYCVKDVAWAIK